MGFNIDKYDRRRFHSKPDIDKKIKALYLWFDYEVERRNMSLDDQVIYIDHWIEVFEEKELYEVIPFFIIRKEVIQKRINLREAAIMSEQNRLALKLKKWFMRLFSKKSK